MKKRTFSPIFELAFAAGIMVILALPLLVSAQDHKEFKVTINDADTTVNGKNIKDLSPGERSEALKKINSLNDHIRFTVQTDGNRDVIIKRKNGDNNTEIIMDGEGLAKAFAPLSRVYFKRDSNGKNIELLTDRISGDENGNMSRFELSAPRIMADGGGRTISLNSFNRKNTQNFSYSNTDNDGISTRVNFRVSDAGEDNLKKITGAEKADLEIHDLNLVPLFSTGKTMLSFALTAKAVADVTFKNSEGTVLWSGKTTTGGEFTKSFELPKNGVYYLQVKQAGKLALRRIVKEE
jgi:hypothetical protein